MKAKQARISAEDVQKALEKFQAGGGLIQKLPDQPSPQRRMVGGKWGAYEPVLEGLRLAPSSAE
jgi:hypothetical protein